MKLPKRIVIFLVIVTALSLVARFLPHSPNFVPVGALALLVGIVFKNNFLALLVPLLVFLSDIFIGFYEWKVMVSVYLGFFIYFWVGKMLKEEKFKIILAPITGAVIFFIITNFAVWAFTPLYPKSLEGLMFSYIFAVPFFKSTLFADFIFLATFSGAFSLILNWGNAKVKILSFFSSSAKIFVQK